MTLISIVVPTHNESGNVQVLHQRIANLIFLGGELRVGRRLLVQNRQDCTRITAIDGTADVARFEAESRGCGSRHGTNIRHLSIGFHEIAGLHGCAQLFSGLLQVVIRLGSIG